MLRRRHGDSDMARPYRRQGNTLKCFHFRALTMGVDYPAAVEITSAVNNLYLVTGLHAQNSATMLRIAFGQKGRAVNIGSVETDHY